MVVLELDNANSRTSEAGATMLTSGVPARDEYLGIESDPTYRELLEFSRKFERDCHVGSRSVRDYGSKWVQDPFLQWSRRWEYLYVAQRLAAWLAGRKRPATVVDAGSGFTFFPFYLLQAHPDLVVDCYDNDPIAGQALAHATSVLGTGPGFHIEDLESLSGEEGTIDAVYSVSVIEHTKNPRKVVDEINRVLKPGGLFVCTFDVSFEKRSPMHVRHVEKLVDHIVEVFDLSPDWQPIDFASLPADNSIVATSWDSDAVRSALPWRNPTLVWLYDLLRGRFRSTLSRPMTFCCVTATSKTVSA